MSNAPKVGEQATTSAVAAKITPRPEEKTVVPALAAAKPARQSTRKKAKPEEVVTPIAEATAKLTKETKPKKKPKLVRDSFTFPESDYALIAELKQRALASGQEIKKSEVLRAGLAALAAMTDKNFLKALESVERIKTGRPSK